jgi:hypothetical protein
VRRATAKDIGSNECKRRKIRCSGETPCGRCGNLGLDCQYAQNCCPNFKDSDEFKHMTAHLAALQQQVDDLYSSLAALRTPGTASALFSDHAPPIPSARPRTKSVSKHPRFHGPTSSAFNLGVARLSLRTMGISAAEDDEAALAHDATPRASPPVSGPALSLQPLHADKDPIWNISKHDAMRLVNVWHEEQGVMYPILDMDKMLRYADMLFTFIEAAARSGLMQGALPGADAIMDEQTSVLKLILAIALVLEGGGKDALGERLFENVHNVVEKTLFEPVGLHGINLLALTASRSSQNTMTSLTPPGHVPLHKGRRSAGLARHWPGCTAMSRVGLAPP